MISDHRIGVLMLAQIELLEGLEKERKHFKQDPEIRKMLELTIRIIYFFFKLSECVRLFLRVKAELKSYLNLILFVRAKHLECSLDTQYR